MSGYVRVKPDVSTRTKRCLVTMNNGGYVVTLVKSDSFYSVELGRIVSGKCWMLGKHRVDWDSALGFVWADGCTLATDVWDVYAAADCVSEYSEALLGR